MVLKTVTIPTTKRREILKRLPSLRFSFGERCDSPMPRQSRSEWNRGDVAAFGEVALLGMSFGSIIPSSSDQSRHNQRGWVIRFIEHHFQFVAFLQFIPVCVATQWTKN